jgi:hypothetical protein
MKISKRIYFLVIEQPDTVSDTRMKEHIEDATSSWGGQLHPDDPLFDKLKVTVKSEKDIFKAFTK